MTAAVEAVVGKVIFRTFGVLVAEKGATWCSFKPNVNLENVHPENFCYIFSKKNFPMF